MKKIKTYKIMAMISALVLTLLLMACGGSNKPENMLIGNWLSNYNDIAIFEEDGRCTAPFTYNASWGKVQIIIYLKKMGRWCLAAVKDMQEELMIKRRQQKRQGIIVVSII